MADIDLNRLLSSIDNITSSFNEIGQEQSRYVELIRRSSREDLEQLRGMLRDNETLLKEVIDNEIKRRNASIEELQNLYNRQAELERDYQSTISNLKNAETDYQRNYFEQKQQQLEEELNQTQTKIDLNNAIIQGEQEAYQKRKSQFEQEQLQRAEELNNKRKHEQELEEARKKQVENIKEFNNTISNVVSDILGNITGRFTSAVDSITSAYQEHAGKLSAQLNATVENVSQLQHNIASTLNDTSLSKAISNIQVLNEAATLASAGYTDQTTLQQNATDIAIGRQIAPNLDFNSTTVRNLINVFGSDFTSKFAAIAAATQETAGSTAGMAETITKLTTDLEPVYLNAELQAAAMQGTGDVSATISSAIEQGIITESQADEYRSMLVELMDPSKALKSSNVAVRVAATQYQWDGNPANALNALLSSTRQMYSSVDQSNTYEGFLTRSLYSSAMGLNNTMDATYNQQGLTGVQMLSTGNLDQTYQEQLNKLESGEYTTRETKLQNEFLNSAFAQNVADFAKTFPITYKAVSATIIASINSIPRQLSSTLNSFISNRSKTSTVADIAEDVLDADGNPIAGGGTNGGKRGGLGSTLGNLLLSPNSSSGFGKAGSTLAKITGANLSGVAGAGVVLGGIGSGLNVASYYQNNEGSTLERLTYGGDELQSALSYGSMGASLGFLVGSAIPGVGNALGTVVGGAVGAITGLTMALFASNDATERQIAAQEALTKATEDTLGYQVKALSAAEAKAAVASGGGTIALNSGTYAIDADYYNSLPKYATGLDYVPYDDYVVRLHKGEAIVTANAAQTLRNSDPNFWSAPVIHNDDVVYELKDQTDKIVRAVKGEDKFESMSYQGPQTFVIQNNET